MGAIHGTVLDAAGRPVIAARVFYLAGPDPLPEVAALTDADGRFALAAARAGRYRLGGASDAAGAGEAEVDVEVGSGDARVVIRLRP